MDNAELLDALQSDLITAGIARKPGVAGPAAGAPYPVYIEPRDGVPKPGDKSGVEANSDAVLGLRISGGFAQPAREEAWFLPTVDVVYRVGDKAHLAMELDKDIDLRWTGRLNSQFGTGAEARLVIECLRWRALGPVVHNRDHGFEFIAAWRFQTYRN